VLSLIYLNITFTFIAISLMLTFLYALQKLNQSLTEVNKFYGFFNSEIPRLDRIMEFFNQYDVFEESTGKIVPKKFMQKKLIIEDVSLRYESNASENFKGKSVDFVLRNINLSVEKGQTIALVGESGSGKTSLANLIVRLYNPTKGRILIDGVDICDFDLNFLRSRIGLINQDTVLFNKSIRDNLLFGRKGATEKEMIDASKKAHVHEFVTQFPDGYDTLIGDRGVKLSGGQRQRLNIAQVFLKKPEIMILDEATSALDTKSEEYIQESINKIAKNCTSIIIAHRLSTVRHADKVVVLEKGRIVEEGCWKSLMESKGAFNKMVQRQFFLNEAV
jgi:subfamily B ATP-binding cassette protein MsbA